MNTRTHRVNYNLILFGLLLMFGTACQKQEPIITATAIVTAISDENNLTFVTIDLYETEWINSGYSQQIPALVAITATEDITQLDRLIRVEQQEQLHQLDFNEVFALALFQGIKPSTQYNVAVERVEYTNGIVSVFAQFIEPEPETTVGDEVISPYRVVQVSKPIDWEEKNTFNLIVEGIVVASDTINKLSDIP